MTLKQGGRSMRLSSRIDALCSAVPGCSRPVVSKGFCNAHYLQFLKGEPFKHVQNRKPFKRCSVKGCERPHSAYGYCGTHRKQFVRHGVTWKPGTPPGSPIEVNADLATVRLSNGSDCVIDAIDVPLVSPYRWHRGAGGYAQASTRDGSDRKVWMHRVILGIADQSAAVIQGDHIDGDRLNNRRSNLRAVTPAQNAQNAVRPNRRQWRGVTQDKRTGRWKAMVTVNRKIISGGWFSTPEEAREVAIGLRAKYLTHYNEARHEFPAPESTSSALQLAGVC